MGTYLNPGKNGFQIARNSEIFIDKSEMILYFNSVVNTSQRYVSVSRPRRFGKTIEANMICAYYGNGSESRELFDKCKISMAIDDGAKWDQYLGQFDVIRLVMTDFFRLGSTVEAGLERLQKLILRDFIS